MKTKSTTAVMLSTVTLLFALIAAAPRAQAQGGVPLWTNRYHGPTNTYSVVKAVAVDGSTGPTSYWDYATAVAVDGNGNVIVAGSSGTSGPSSTDSDFVTIKYSSVNPPAPLLAIQRTPTNTVVISWPSPSTGFVLQQNTNGLGSVNWSNVTGTIQDNGTNRSIIVNPPGGNRFYRLVKP